MSRRSRASFGRFPWLLAIGATLACASPSSAQGKSINTFADYLAQGYRQISAAAQQLPSRNRLPSYYANRSAMAMSGSELSPEMPDARFLDAGTLREATFARRQLIESLQRG